MPEQHLGAVFGEERPAAQNGCPGSAPLIPFCESLSYVSPRNTVMLPTAHMLLTPDNDPIICSKRAIRLR